LAWPPAI